MEQLARWGWTHSEVETQVCVEGERDDSGAMAALKVHNGGFTKLKLHAVREEQRGMSCG